MRLAVHGIPVPQGSKRHVGKGIMVEAGGAKLKDWRSDIRREAIEQRVHLYRGPIQVELDFFFPRPKAHFGTGRNAGTVKQSAPRMPATRPDIDKLARAALDALTGVCFMDDAQVAVLVCRKLYAPDGTPPGVVVEIGAL